MELKNAVALCLISLFSATLVVLIARSLDSQAAARLEPQLTQIVEELRALRGQGGIAATAGDSANADAVRDGLVVYYFHSNVRCPTCRSIESQAQETVETHFASQLKDGEVAWKIVNYEQPSAKSLATKYEIQMPVVVLVKMKDGNAEDWRRLDKVWALVGDKPAFIEYVRGEIAQMLAPDTNVEIETPNAAIPLPDTDTPSTEEASAIPVP